MKKIFFFLLTLGLLSTSNLKAEIITTICDDCIYIDPMTGQYFLRLSVTHAVAYPAVKVAFENFPTTILNYDPTMTSSATPCTQDGVGNYYYYNLSSYPAILADILTPGPAPYAKYQWGITTWTGYAGTGTIYEVTEFCDRVDIPGDCVGHFSYTEYTPYLNQNGSGLYKVKFDDMDLNGFPQISTAVTDFITNNPTWCEEWGPNTYYGVVVYDEWDFDGDAVIDVSMNSFINASLYDNSTIPNLLGWEYNYAGAATYNVCHTKRVVVACIHYAIIFGHIVPVGQTTEDDGWEEVVLYDCKVCTCICVGDPEITNMMEGKPAGSRKPQIVDKYLDGILVYPNPSNGAFKVKFNSMKSENSTIILKDMSGRVIFEHQAILTKGINVIEISAPNVPVGNYMVEVKSASGTINKHEKLTLQGSLK